MNIIIVSKPFASTRILRLGDRRQHWLAIAAVALMLTGVLALGTFIGARFVGPDHLRSQLLGARSQLDQQKSEVDRLNGMVTRDMGALAVKLGRIQAESTRINALGERLAKLGKLDDGEFDFSSEPGLGGPVQDSIAESVPPDQFSAELFRLQRQLAQQTQQLTLLERLLEDRSIDQSMMPSGIPVHTGYVSSRFGYRHDPINGSREFHSGIDFNGKLGDDVLAVAGGVVSFSGQKSGYGNVVEIDHGNGYVTRYAHNSRLLLQVGDPVRPGDVIAKVGSTGRSTGTHVHFEVWENGRVVNPLNFIQGQR
ncbi:MAG: peptidase M23 [Lysobacterales bacterium CG02_land_8_20_14_3_00_62_12]|nr:MAG: peptidase M23 [Xanthomonadales bacterium CG02_land_8_20_14_3_00_62_12]